MTCSSQELQQRWSVQHGGQTTITIGIHSRGGQGQAVPDAVKQQGYQGTRGKSEH